MQCFVGICEYFSELCLQFISTSYTDNCSKCLVGFCICIHYNGSNGIILHHVLGDECVLCFYGFILIEWWEWHANHSSICFVGLGQCSYYFGRYSFLCHCV